MLRAQAFAQRVLADEPFELCRQLGMAAETKIGFDSHLERFETPLLELCSRVLRERLVGEVGKRRTPPQRQSRSEELRGALGSIGASAARPSSTSRSKRSASMRSGSTSKAYPPLVLTRTSSTSALRRCDT